MPGQIYMGADYRPDHSLRIPRPDLSVELGTPNACSAQGCHADKSLAWNVEKFTKWYGEARKPHYGTVIAAGRAQAPKAEADLIRLAEDSLVPAIVRATALELLRAYPSVASRALLAKALDDADPLLRYTAIRSLEYFDVETRLKRIAPKLYDPVKAVRIEAAMMLSRLPEEQLREDDRETFRNVLEEYRQAMLYNADLAAQRYNLGNLAVNREHAEEAISHYQKSIAIDDQFFPAKVNLAMLYNSQGNNDQAETLLREVMTLNPESFETAYSLGLLLAEMGKLEDAVIYLGVAANGMPDYARAQYNYGLALLQLARYAEGEGWLLKALGLEPRNREYFVALVNLYLRAKKVDKAVLLAQGLLQSDPEHPDALEFLGQIREQYGK
jgi:tetratricopeptide (TPR) repeat protein